MEHEHCIKYQRPNQSAFCEDSMTMVYEPPDRLSKHNC